jgi:cyclopropane fatty-acyl-phospholipid synthase-like methyltransferase
MQPEAYTSKEYWENYYAKSALDVAQIKQICGKYDDIWEKMVEACPQKPKTIIEIGAYPGRYVAYLASKYQLLPTALDYNSDVNKIRSSFEVMEVSNAKTIQTDFTAYVPEEKFDIIISLGFIEHFEKFNEILDRHLLYAHENSTFVITVPNKKYLRKWYGYACDYQNLKVHNLNCMTKQVFNDFAKRNNLKIHYLEYYGGFAYAVHQPLNVFQKIIYHTFRFVFKRINPYLEKHPGKYYSQMLIGIFSR